MDFSDIGPGPRTGHRKWLCCLGIPLRNRSGRKTSGRPRSKYRFFYLIALVIGVWLWWSGWGWQRRGGAAVGGHAHQELDLAGLKFIPASHPFLHFVGRWTSSLDNSRRDGLFPGVYFDIALNHSTTLALSLHNVANTTVDSAEKETRPLPAFLQTTKGNLGASPISLLARVDEEDYLVIPEASFLVEIRRDLDPHSTHEIRIIAPMVGVDAIEILQLEGIWIDEKASLIPVDGIGSRNSSGNLKVPGQRKVLEVITDMPGTTRSSKQKLGIEHDILSSARSWEFMLGDMFNADRVTIGIDGMCLIHGCVGGRGTPKGLGDVFFQSGPPQTEQFFQLWTFESYIPDVMVLNIGNSDWESFAVHADDYETMTVEELLQLFEDTYVLLVKAIRLAYENSTTELQIFVMRPLLGQLEGTTRSVVKRLRHDGDSLTYWLDTSEWLVTDIDTDKRPEEQDIYIDEESLSKQWRLTERGNQKVAMFLHWHVCRYLARDAVKEHCALPPPTHYDDEALDPDARYFDELVEDRKTGRLSRLSG